jgi:hypothetical protein
MKSISFIVMFLCAAYAACSQYTDSTTHYIGYSATGVINKTNDGSSYVLNNNLRFGVRKKKVSLNTAAGWIYGENNGNRTNNDFTAALDFNLFTKKQHFYYWGLATYEKSQSLKINDRAQVGLGAAYNVVENPTIFLNLSDGILFENSDLFLPDGKRDLYTTFRNSFRLRYRWTHKNILVIDGTHFLQNSVTDISDYVIKSISTVSLKLTKWLNFTSSVTYNKVNRTERENLLITFGLTLEKYF